MNIIKNKSLKNYNTFHVDANADQFVEITCESNLEYLFSNGTIRENVVFILGGGSNVLFTSDFNGIVLYNNIPGKKIIKTIGNTVILEVNSGENWENLVDYCVENDLGGIENLSLIPGKAGASPIQNIGAYGVELKDVFQKLEGFYLESGKKGVFTKEECGFSYRNSVFKNELKNKFIVTKVYLKLTIKKHELNTDYTALQDKLKEKSKELTLSNISEAVKEIRRSKLPDPKIIGNAGSFFKNPIVSKEQINELLVEYPGIKYFHYIDDKVKVAAGWLIENAGLKGYEMNNAAVYNKQALVIINKNNAKGSEIKDFAYFIIDKVKNMFKIELEPEVNII